MASANGSYVGHDHSGTEGCAICGLHLPFEFPKELYEAICSGKAVFFVGAGACTESPKVFPHTMYEEAKVDSGLDPEADVSFADVMTAYEDKYGRPALLQMIRERFDYIRSYPELLRAASEFHRELAAIVPITDIFTTNWDTYFEDFTSCVPIVVPNDYHFWDVPGRKVFKIHGSINNLSTIVATAEDYSRCLAELQTGVIGSTLKHLLATRTVVFLGYSLRDEDFHQIYSFLRDELTTAMPRAYLVTIDESPSVPSSLDLKVIRTDAVFFVRELKRLLIDDEIVLSDDIYTIADHHRQAVNETHQRLSERVDIAKFPAAVFCFAYQDGLLHAFNRMIERRGTGEYGDPHRMVHLVESYEEIQKVRRRNKRYWDVAYLEGYKTGLMVPMVELEERVDFPHFFVLGADHDIYSMTDFKKTIKDGPLIHKAAFRQAEKIVHATDGGRLVPHHTPFL